MTSSNNLSYKIGLPATTSSPGLTNNLGLVIPIKSPGFRAKEEDEIELIISPAIPPIRLMSKPFFRLIFSDIYFICY